MSTSQARIDANRRNAQLSTGPRTEEGKQKSRANALKHGLTGAGIVLPEDDAVEVERRAAAFAEELNATGEVGSALARRAALSSVRMERAADQQTAALSEHVRKVMEEFVPPEGVDPQEAERLLAEAVRRAMFDPSKEATLARKYEAAPSGPSSAASRNSVSGRGRRRPSPGPPAPRRPTWVRFWRRSRRRSGWR